MRCVLDPRDIFKVSDVFFRPEMFFGLTYVFLVKDICFRLKEVFWARDKW